MCKHVAAVLYGVGAGLDAEPELFFTLRGADMTELVAVESAKSLTAADSVDDLGESDLANVFGVKFADSPFSVTKVKKRPSAKAKRVPRKRASAPKPVSRKR